MSKLSDFVKEAIAGNILTEGSVVSNGLIVEGFVILSDDPISITAEAFNRDLFSSNTSWDDALVQVKAIMEE